MKTASIAGTVFIWALIAGGGGPLIPPLGFGPDLDQFAAFAMLLVLIALGWRPIKNTLGSRFNTISPIDILRKRYAQGVISEEEYLHMREEVSLSRTGERGR